MWRNSENKCHPQASRRSLQSGTWKDWMSISQCAAGLSCLNALHDDDHTLNAFTWFMCLWMSHVVALLLLLCLFHGFLSMKAPSHRHRQAGFFYRHWCTVDDKYALGGFFKQKLHILQYIPNLLLVGPNWVSRSFSVCGILAFLW